MKNKHLKKILIQLEIIKLQFWKFLFKLLRKAFGYFSYVLTIIVSIITIAKFFDASVQYEQVNVLGLHFDFNVLLVIIAAGSVIAAIIVLWPKLCSETKINNELTVIVECCNLLSQEGVKVIHTTDTFDMNRIKKKSLVDQFVQLCKDKEFDLANAIKAHIPSDDFLSIDDDLPGEKKRYKLGAVCPIAIPSGIEGEEESYCLVAFSHILPGTVCLPLAEYRPMLINMWHNLS